MAIDPRVDIGHVHLKVGDNEPPVGFSCGVLGLQLQRRHGAQAALVPPDGSRRALGLNARESPAGCPPARTGLHHVATRCSDRHTLAVALRRVRETGVTLEGASGHILGAALDGRDPESRVMEVCPGRPREGRPCCGNAAPEMAASASGEAPDVVLVRPEGRFDRDLDAGAPAPDN
jgi:catechol 2,3-dioxygenase